MIECGAVQTIEFKSLKVQNCVNLVGLVKGFQTTIYYLLVTLGVDTAGNGPLKVCQQLAES